MKFTITGLSITLCAAFVGASPMPSDEADGPDTVDQNIHIEMRVYTSGGCVRENTQGTGVRDGARWAISKQACQSVTDAGSVWPTIIVPPDTCPCFPIAWSGTNCHGEKWVFDEGMCNSRLFGSLSVECFPAEGPCPPPLPWPPRLN